MHSLAILPSTRVIKAPAFRGVSSRKRGLRQRRGQAEDIKTALDGQTLSHRYRLVLSA